MEAVLALFLKILKIKFTDNRFLVKSYQIIVSISIIYYTQSL
jgi:hypothetical protein